MLQSLSLRIDEQTQVGEARRAVSQLALDANFTEVETARAAVVAAELSSNLVKHAGGGSLIARLFQRNDARVIEVLTIDSGPGLRDVPGSLRDGFSTAGSPGTGLGAVKRSAAFFDLYSRPGAGTAIVAHIASTSAQLPVSSSPLSRELVAGAVCLPKPGEKACGDAWEIVATERGMRILVADGLGHGEAAAQASTEASDVFRKTATRSIDEQMQAMHAALRATRGAAAAIADIDRSAGELRYAGVGNIAGLVVRDGTVRRTVSHNGIVGHEMRKVQEFRYDWRDGDTLLMHSDGLSMQWDIARYPGLMAAHPSLVAAFAWRDQSRGRDDSTVVVVNVSTAGAA